MSGNKQFKTEYIKLTEEGCKKYGEVQREANLTFGLWAVGGATVGFMWMKLIENMKVINKIPLIKKYKRAPLYLSFFMLSYHGYKLSNFQKRKGIRQLSKDQTNVQTKSLTENNQQQN